MTKIYLTNINVSLSQHYIDLLLSYVSIARKEQFYKFIFYKDSLRGLFGEVLVRYMISNLFSINNSNIIIDKNAYGKPYIKNSHIFFNISHAGDWVVCAISSHDIGIDIEQIEKNRHNISDIAQHFFHEEEYHFLQTKSEAQWYDTFYDLWTLKESYIKWLGIGLSKSLNSFICKIQDSRIDVIDEGHSFSPFFKQYPLDDYKLSVCSSTSILPEEFSIIDIKNDLLLSL
jgi:4'-phosphopantetheinyl transferase